MEEQDKIKIIMKKLIDSGCSENIIKSFMLNNYDFLMNNIDSIKDNMFFLFNGEDLYAIVIMMEDKYLWSNIDNLDVTKLKDSSEYILGDYVIEDILRFGEDGKFKEIIPNLSDNYLENIRILKKIKFNRNGYYIK